MHQITPNQTKLLINTPLDTIETTISNICTTLTTHKTLTTLSIFFNITDDTCIPISQMLKENTSITSIDFKGNEISAAGCSMLCQGLKENNTVRHVKLKYNHIGDEGCLALCDLLEESKLESLCLANTFMSEIGFCRLCDVLKENDDLMCIDLSGNAICTAILEIGDVFNVNETLRVVNLGYTRMDMCGCKSLSEGLKRNRSVVELDIGYNYIGDDGCKALASALRVNDCLEVLKCLRCRFGSEGCVALCDALKENRTLQVLELELNDVGDDGCLAICDMLEVNCTISVIDIGNINMMMNGYRRLCEVLKVNQTISKLYLTGNTVIGEEGCILLSEMLMENNTISFLDISACHIGPEGCKEIGEVLKENITLSVLNVGSNPGFRDGCYHIANALKENYTLSEIFLYGMEYGEHELAYIFDALKFNTTLKAIDITYSNTANVDTVCESLASLLKENITLNFVMLFNYNYTKAGLKMINDAMIYNTSITEFHLDDPDDEEKDCEISRLFEYINLNRDPDEDYGEPYEDWQ